MIQRISKNNDLILQVYIDVIEGMDSITATYFTNDDYSYTVSLLTTKNSQEVRIPMDELQKMADGQLKSKVIYIYDDSLFPDNTNDNEITQFLDVWLYSGDNPTPDYDTTVYWGKIVGDITEQDDLQAALQDIRDDFPINVSDLNNDSNFATQTYVIQQISNLSINDYLTKSEARSTYQPKGNYALEDDIPTRTSQLTNDSGFLTTHQSLDDYLMKSEASRLYQPVGRYLTEIPSDYITETELNARGYITYSFANSLYQPKGDYITSSDIQDDYYSKSEVNALIPTKTSDLTNDSGYTTIAEVGRQGYVTNGALADYATKNYVDSAVQSMDLSSYLTKTEASLTYATIASLPTKVSDLTNDSGFQTASQVMSIIDNNVPTKTSQLTNDSGFQNATQVLSAINNNMPTKVSQLTNDSGYITSQSLSIYALKSEIPTKVSDLTNDTGFITALALSNYYTKTETDNLIATSGSSLSSDILDTVSETYAEKSEIPTKTSDLTNDSGYITSLEGYLTKAQADLLYQPIGNYALASQLPTKVSDLTNDSGFLTAIPSEYITETELAGYGYLTSVSAAQTYQPIGNYASANVVSSTSNGLAPMSVGDNTKITDVFYVLAFTGSNTPNWYKLPDNAFNDTKYYATDGVTINSSNYIGLDLFSTDRLSGAIDGDQLRAVRRDVNGKLCVQVWDSGYKSVDYATMAEKATNDGNNNVIATTYATITYVDSKIGEIETALTTILG